MWWQQRLGDQPFFFGDSDGYWELARTIAASEPYQYRSPDMRVFRTPGYPALLSPAFVVYGEHPPVLAARAIGAVLGTLAVGLAGWWATLLFDARTGILAGLIVALYPGAIALSVFVLSEAPFVPLMLAHLALWTAAWRTENRRKRLAFATGAGIVASMATLMRPSWLLFTPFAIVLGLAIARDRRRQWVIGGAMLAALAMGMVPWWMYTMRVSGRFVATTLQVGASLYDGLHAGATGASDMRFVPEVTARERAEGDPLSPEAFEVRVDRRMWNESIAWAKAHPGEVLRLAVVKLKRMWNVWPNEPAFRGWPTRIVLLATYVPLLAMGLCGAWRWTSQGLPYCLAWLPAVYLTLLHTVFVSSLRYREPAMIALAILASGAIVQLATRRAPISISTRLEG